MGYACERLGPAMCSTNTHVFSLGVLAGGCCVSVYSGVWDSAGRYCDKLPELMREQYVYNNNVHHS